MTIKVEGRVVRRRFRTKKLADDEYSRLREAGRTGSFIAPADARITVGEYAELWLASKHVRASTHDRYTNDVRAHIVPALGARWIGRIRRQEVNGFIGALIAKPLSPATVQLVYKVLAMIFRSAVDDRRIAVSPCYRIELPEIPPASWWYSPPAKRSCCWKPRNRNTRRCS